MTLSSDVETSGGLFLDEKVYPLRCLVEGFPLDIENLNWTFKPCKAIDDCEQTEEIITPGANLVKEELYLLWKDALWLDKTIHVTYNVQSECFNSKCSSYPSLKFFYEVDAD